MISNGRRNANRPDRPFKYILACLILISDLGLMAFLGLNEMKSAIVAIHLIGIALFVAFGKHDA